MPRVMGEIVTLNSELEYGMVANSKIGKIFFSPDTSYNGVLFKDLKLDEKVSVEVKDTPRGFFATSLERVAEKRKAPEATL